MACTGVEKAFCVLQFAKCESIVMVQCQFRTQYHKDQPTDKPICIWYNNFEQTGSLSAGKRGVRPAKCVGCGRRACKRSIHSEPPKLPDLSPCEFFLWGYVKDHVSPPLYPSIQQSCDKGLSMQSLLLTFRCWYMYGRSWIIGSMSAESPTVGIWKTCKVCTKTLRDTLSSGTNLFSMSAMVTDLQTHETHRDF